MSLIRNAVSYLLWVFNTLSPLSSLAEPYAPLLALRYCKALTKKDLISISRLRCRDFVVGCGWLADNNTQSAIVLHTKDQMGGEMGD